MVVEGETGEPPGQFSARRLAGFSSAAGDRRDAARVAHRASIGMLSTGETGEATGTSQALAYRIREAARDWLREAVGLSCGIRETLFARMGH